MTPEVFPKLSHNALDTMRDMSYQQRAVYVMNSYLDDFTASELSAYADKAYGGEKFDVKEVAPVRAVDENTYCLELWHGPTCAFKDMALQMLPHLLSASLVKNQEEKTVCILVATSGDTGKAALEGFKDVDKTRILVFYPKDGVSAIQELQMNTQEGDNVGVCSVAGNFDDAQTGVKRLFSDEALREKLAGRGFFLSSANSINWGRVLPQIVYYISAYCDLLREGRIQKGERIERLRPNRQLRQHSGRLLRQGDGRAHRQAHLRLQQQQCTDRLPVHWRVRPQPHLLQYDVPLHGYPDLLQLGAAALLPVQPRRRRGARVYGGAGPVRAV